MAVLGLYLLAYSPLLAPPRLPIQAASGSTAQAAPQYPVFEDDKLPISLYSARRQKVKQTLGANGVALFLTNPERNRNNDCDFRFRADSNFLYLTGFEEPDAALLVAPGGIEVDGKRVTEVLFLNLSDPMSETWLGYRMGPKESVRLLGVEAAVSNDRFLEILGKVDRTKSQVFTAAQPPSLTGTVAKMSTDFAGWVASGGQPAQSGLNRAIMKMRVEKSPEEIGLLRKAADASVLAHLEAMRSATPGMREFEIQALVEYAFTRNGCESTAYNSIVASGPNACILHYEADRRLMKDGDLICMDVAGEYHGYAADVTRSYPVNGKFSPEQKAIYELVLAAQDAGIAECRNGKPFRAPHNAATKVLTEGMIKLGIIKTPGELGRYFMHGTSHFIGLDVHDSQGDNTLRPNYALTVEPGIYIKAGSPCDKKWWNIGVRIEDDILVTTGDPINLSGALPRKVAEIEAVMKEKGIGNSPLRYAKTPMK